MHTQTQVYTSFDAIPCVPAALKPFAPVVVGAVARCCQDARFPYFGPPEVLATATKAELLALSGAVSGPAGSVEYQEWRIWPVSDPLVWLKSRALTIEAIGVDAQDHDIDPLGGLQDLRSGVIRLAQKPTPDQIPLLAATTAALQSELCLRVDPQLESLLAQEPHKAYYADRTLLREALTRLLVGRQVREGLDLLMRVGFLNFVLPELSAFYDFHLTPGFHHKDLWAHTLQVVEQIAPTPILRWTALFHDIGKVATRARDAHGHVHFLRHEDVGAYLFEGIAARLRFDPTEAKRISRLIAVHLRAHLYDPSWNDAACRRFALDIGELRDDLFELSLADCTSARPGRRDAVRYRFEGFQKRLKELDQSAQKKQSLPRGLGDAIANAFSLTRGPILGELRNLCQAAADEGRLEDPSIADCLDFLEDARPDLKRSDKKI